MPLLDVHTHDTQKSWICTTVRHRSLYINIEYWVSFLCISTGRFLACDKRTVNLTRIQFQLSYCPERSYFEFDGGNFISTKENNMNIRKKQAIDQGLSHQRRRSRGVRKTVSVLSAVTAMNTVKRHFRDSSNEGTRIGPGQWPSIKTEDEWLWYWG